MPKPILILLNTTECLSLLQILRDAVGGSLYVVLLSETCEVLDAPKGFNPPASFSALLESWRCGTEEYDTKIHSSSLENFPLFGSVLPILPDKLRTPFVRNAVVHCVDAARVCGDRFCILLRKNMQAGHVDLRKAAGGDEHLHHALRQMGLEIEFTEKIFNIIADSLTEFINQKPKLQNQVARQKRNENIGRLLTAIGMILNFAGFISALAIAATFAFFHREPPAWIPWESFVAIYAASWGMFATPVPTRPAFPVLDQNQVINQRRCRSYRMPLLVHGLFLLLFCWQGYYSIIQLPAVCLGFFIGLLAEHYRAYVFLARIRLQSLTSAYSSRNPELSEISKLLTASTHSSMSENNRWDALAQRLQVVSRDFYCPRTFVFISYGWNALDQEFAEKFKRFLDSRGIDSFLDRNRITRGAQWRGIIAENLFRCTHFIFIVSPRSICGVTCTDEVRFMLELMAIHTRPGISLCVLEEPDDQVFDSSDPAFMYIWKRADKVSSEELLTPDGVARWLERNRSSSWLSDAFQRGTRRIEDATCRHYQDEARKLESFEKLNPEIPSGELISRYFVLNLKDYPSYVRKHIKLTANMDGSEILCKVMWLLATYDLGIYGKATRNDWETVYRAFVKCIGDRWR